MRDKPIPQIIIRIQGSSVILEFGHERGDSLNVYLAWPDKISNLKIHVTSC